MKRACGSCTLCCRLLPLRELNLGANERCPHQRHNKGCAIYKSKPMSCSLWNCRWLVNDDAADLKRPDRGGYVVDILPDHVELEDNATKQRTAIEVVQVWVDPNRPTAHRDPALRAFLDRRGREGIAALIRFHSYEATVLLPPSMTSDGKWHDSRSECRQTMTDQHSLADTIAALGASKQVKIVVEE
jgi:hypothetical protein